MLRAAEMEISTALWPVWLGKNSMFYTETQVVHYYYTRLIFSRTNWISRYQKGKTSLDSNEARDDGVWGWQWHQLDHTRKICTSLQTDNHNNIASLNFYRPDALPDAQPTVSKHWKRMEQCISIQTQRGVNHQQAYRNTAELTPVRVPVTSAVTSRDFAVNCTKPRGSTVQVTWSAESRAPLTTDETGSGVRLSTNVSTTPCRADASTHTNDPLLVHNVT